MNNSRTPKYMPLAYDVVQRYCSHGFPTKYVCNHRAQYGRTIDAAIYIYYKLLRTGEHELSDDECKKMFGNCFFSEQNFDELKEDAVILCLEGDKPGRIEKEKQDGHWQKSFEENWRKKRGILLRNQIEKGQIIIDNLFCVEEFDELAERGAMLKTVINFLEKLEAESHDAIHIFQHLFMTLVYSKKIWLSAGKGAWTESKSVRCTKKRSPQEEL